MMWEIGAVSTEYLETLYKDIPVNLAINAKKNNLLEKDSWKKLKRLARQLKLIKRLVKQAKLRSFQISPSYKYGFEVPKNFKHAEKLDKKNGNTKGMDFNKLEHKQLDDYDVFIDKGKSTGYKILRGFRLIRVHTIFDVNVDGRQNS